MISLNVMALVLADTPLRTEMRPKAKKRRMLSTSLLTASFQAHVRIYTAATKPSSTRSASDAEEKIFVQRYSRSAVSIRQVTFQTRQASGTNVEAAFEKKELQTLKAVVRSSARRGRARKIFRSSPAGRVVHLTARPRRKFRKSSELFDSRALSPAVRATSKSLNSRTRRRRGRKEN